MQPILQGVDPRQIRSQPENDRRRKALEEARQPGKEAIEVELVRHFAHRIRKDIVEFMILQKSQVLAEGVLRHRVCSQGCELGVQVHDAVAVAAVGGVEVLCDEADLLLHEREDLEDGFLGKSRVELSPSSAVVVMVDDAGEGLVETESADAFETLVALSPSGCGHLAVKGGLVDVDLVGVDADDWACGVLT